MSGIIDGKVYPMFPQSVNGLLNLWQGVQTKVKDMKRWQRFLNLGLPIREQDILGHIAGFYIIAFHYINLLESKGVKINGALLRDAIVIHDLPEGLIGEDIPVPLKNLGQEVVEFNALETFLKECGFNEDESLAYLRAYSLQLSFKRLKEVSEISYKPKRQIEHLKNYENLTAQIFLALQDIDYLFYGLEQLRDYGEKYTLLAILDTERDKLAKFASEIPFYDETFYTPELQRWCEKFWEENKVDYQKWRLENKQP